MNRDITNSICSEIKNRTHTILNKARPLSNHDEANPQSILDNAYIEGLPGDKDFYKSGVRDYLNIHNDKDDIKSQNGWRVTRLSTARNDFFNKYVKENLTDSDRQTINPESGFGKYVTRNMVRKANYYSFFDKWFWASDVHRIKEAGPNRGNALEYILGKPSDSNHASDFKDAELKAYNIDSDKITLFQTKPLECYSIEENGNKTIMDYNDIIKEIHNLSDIDIVSRTKTLSKDEKSYTNNTSKTYAKVNLNKEQKPDSVSILTEYFDNTDKKIRKIEVIYDIGNIEKALLEKKELSPFAKIITSKLTWMLKFDTVTLYVNKPETIRLYGNNTNIGVYELFAYTNLVSYKLKGELSDFVKSFISCVNNNIIKIYYTINKKSIEAEFIIPNTMDAFKKLYVPETDAPWLQEDKNTTTYIPNDDIDVIHKSEDVRKQEFNNIIDKVNDPVQQVALKSKNKKLIDSIKTYLNELPSCDNALFDEWYNNNSDEDFCKANKTSKTKNDLLQIFQKILLNYKPTDSDAKINENKNRTIMKIQITENDIRLMAKKAVKKLMENERMRDVRKIIIQNILHKHWAFHGDADVAWAYYVTTHQERREKQELELSPQLVSRFMDALKQESEEIAKEEASKANMKKEAADWFEAHPFDLSEAGWDPERTDYSEEELRQIWDNIEDLYEKKGTMTTTATDYRSGKAGKFYSSEGAWLKRGAVEDIYKRIFKLQEANSKFEYLYAGWVNGHAEREKNGDPKMIEINKRFMLINQDKDAITINTYSDNRGFNGYFNGRYNMYWEVDSSD